MGKYLKKFENHTQYDNYINGSGAILPNVSICTTEGDVHYNPSTPPTPLNVAAVYKNYGKLGDEVELPYCDVDYNTGVFIKINKPISFEELLGLKFEATEPDNCGGESYIWSGKIGQDGRIEWNPNYEYDDPEYGNELYTDYFEGTSDIIKIDSHDYSYTFYRFYFE